jgi:hypothetical protein
MAIHRTEVGQITPTFLPGKPYRRSKDGAAGARGQNGARRRIKKMCSLGNSATFLRESLNSQEVAGGVLVAWAPQPQINFTKPEV